MAASVALLSRPKMREESAYLLIVGVVENGRICGAAVAAEAAEEIESGGKEASHVQRHHGGEEEQHGEEVERQQQGCLQQIFRSSFIMLTGIKK